MSLWIKRDSAPVGADHVRRTVVAMAVAAFCGLLLTAAPASGWNGTFTGQCCYATLESGEVAGGQYFTLRNDGPETWLRGEVRLGTNEPAGRTSVFAHSSWPDPNRPAELAEAAIPPGAVGSFRFTVKAPSVGTQTIFREPFRLVREGIEWFGTMMFLDYTVLPSIPPTVAIEGLPAEVTQGNPLVVKSLVNDNRGVAKVEVRLDDATPVAATASPDGRTFTASLSSVGAPPGTHRVTVVATDRVGNATTASQTLVVVAPPPPAPEQPAALAPTTQAASPSLRRLAAFKPVFATRAARRGRSLGSLFTTEVQITGGSRLEIVCARGCSRSRTIKRVQGRAPKRLAVNLRPAWTLKRGAVIEIRVLRTGFATRFERYRFTRAGVGLKAKQAGAGCLASIRPRNQVKCPAG